MTDEASTGNRRAYDCPAAEGVRLDWSSVPERVRTVVEAQVGSPVARATSQPSGFSPGVAARLLLADGRRMFVKAVGPKPNPGAPQIHRSEIRVTTALPPSAPVPRLRWSHDDRDSGWVVLVFDDVDGRHPTQPWRLSEIDRVVKALAAMGETLTPSPLAAAEIGSASEALNDYICGWRILREQVRDGNHGLDEWSTHHLGALAELEGTAASLITGDTLLHMDVRADNILMTPDRIWFVDWPHALVGPAWIDVVLFAPSVTMQGGPPPEEVIARHPSIRAADPAAVTAVVVALAGFLTHRALQPPPPGLPTVRAFQAAQGVVAREWAALRTGYC